MYILTHIWYIHTHIYICAHKYLSNFKGRCRLFLWESFAANGMSEIDIFHYPYDLSGVFWEGSSYLQRYLVYQMWRLCEETSWGPAWRQTQRMLGNSLVMLTSECRCWSRSLTLPYLHCKFLRSLLTSLKLSYCFLNNILKMIKLLISLLWKLKEIIVSA